MTRRALVLLLLAGLAPAGAVKLPGRPYVAVRFERIQQ
jgi:hypothetical protein